MSTANTCSTRPRPQMTDFADRPGRRRYGGRGADGRVGSQSTDRRCHARRRGVRPRAGNSRDQRHPRAAEEAGKPVGLDSARQARRRCIAKINEMAEQTTSTRPSASTPSRRARKRSLKSTSRVVTALCTAEEGAAATRIPSTTSCSTSKPRSSAARSSMASRASTAVTPAPCVRSTSVLRFCRAHTAPHFSPVAKRRQSLLRRSAR